MSEANVQKTEKPAASLSTNSVFYLVYNILNVLFPLITGIYVARVLLPDGIGEVEAARNLANYFVILSFLGIPTYGLREVAKVRGDKEKLSKLYGELFVINAISTTVFLSLFVGLVFAIPKYRENLAVNLICGISIALNYLNISWLFEGLEKFRFISLRNIVVKIAAFVLLIVFVRGPGDVLIYAIITVVGTAGNYFWNFLAAPRHAKLTLKNLDLKRHMKSILLLATVNLAIEIYTLVDITMLDWMAEKENVAYYAYAAKIRTILLQVVNTFTMVVVPRLALLYKNGDEDGYKRLISKTLNIIVYLGVAIIVGVWFVANSMLVYIYGENYIQSAMVLKILSFNLLISPIGYLLGSRVCLTRGHENIMVWPVVTGALVNIAMNAIFIPLMKENGAALASVFSEVVVAVVYICITSRFFKPAIDFMNILKILAACTLMIGFLVGTIYIPLPHEWIRLIIQIGGAIALYFGTSLLLRESFSIAVWRKGRGIIQKIAHRREATRCDN